MRLVELMKNEEWMILDGTGIVLVMLWLLCTGTVVGMIFVFTKISQVSSFNTPRSWHAMHKSSTYNTSIQVQHI